MIRKSKKEKPVEEAPPPAPTPEEIPPAPAEDVKVEVEQEPVQAPVQEEPAEAPPAAVPRDEELPPPPSDMVDQANKFPPLNTRKPGFGAALRRAGVIFGKDVSTMAKHGLVGSVIVFALLIVVFLISSYAMLQIVTIKMGDGEGKGDGGDGPNLSNDGSLIAKAGSSIFTPSIISGTSVTLDASGSTHRANIMYEEWRIVGRDGQLAEDVTLYGSPRNYVFHAIGQYEVALSVVDSDFNYDEDNFTVNVTRNGADAIAPTINNIGTTPSGSVMYGSPIRLDANNATDNVGIINYTWMFSDLSDSVSAFRYGQAVSYTYESAGDHMATLIVRDAAGNYNSTKGPIHIDPSGPSGTWPSAKIADLPESVTIGDIIHLGVSNSSGGGTTQYFWIVKLNATTIRMNGQDASFTASDFGMYEITLVARDNVGNAATDNRGVLSLAAGMEMPSAASWTSTPFGEDIPFNVLTFVYGAALLACVIFVGGLFSKGFAYEIQKGTAKTLFFAPISVTSMIFAKLLYPLAMAPIFIFPLMLISTLPLGQDIADVFVITLVSYLMTALILVSAAYGSCLIYVVTKRMSIKPTALARMFMYLSLIATLTIFVGLAFLMDQWMTTDMWSGMYENLGSGLAMFSPFHQGGMLISNMVLGTANSLDWFVFIIPLALIAGGAVVSRKLFPDLFARE